MIYEAIIWLIKEKGIYVDIRLDEEFDIFNFKIMKKFKDDSGYSPLYDSSYDDSIMGKFDDIAEQGIIKALKFIK